ncbi:3-deoxy-D-manno-octulosonic acid transferase [Lichenicola sp.]|uniref:3-deoxy-D-manno-octulosonic acid transferase n=1 Tax=Lichenicola sp. TaxID=2804529 RepID=UPI003B00BA97
MKPPRFGLPFALWAAAATLAAPAIRLNLRRRVATGKEIGKRLGERRGIETAPRPDGTLLWLHAASVGETLSLLPLIDTLCRSRGDLRLLLTTGTVSAQRLLQQRLDEDGLADRVQHRFTPLDVPAWIDRFLDHWRPDMLVLVESELWPNLIVRCARRGIPLVLLNARMSARSARAWGMARFVTRQMFGAFAWITARSAQDAARLRGLGAAAVEHDGDLKQAAAPLPVDEAELDRLRQLLGDRPVWLAASTHAGEETRIALLHRAIATRYPTLLTVIAPRHPERGAAIAAELDDAPRRAEASDPAPEQGIWICDTLGELGLLYRLIGIVFIGNSLAAVEPPGGGHNPLEPARLGCAIAIGPLAQNFEEDVSRMREAGGLVVAPDEPALQAWVERMLSQPEQRQAMADAALEQANASAGLPERLARRLLQLLDRH